MSARWQRAQLFAARALPCDAARACLAEGPNAAPRPQAASKGGLRANARSNLELKARRLGPAAARGAWCSPNASWRAPLRTGTMDAYTHSAAAAYCHGAPCCSSCSAVWPVSASPCATQTIPSIARRPFMISGAGPLNFRASVGKEGPRGARGDLWRSRGGGAPVARGRPAAAGAARAAWVDAARRAREAGARGRAASGAATHRRG